MFNLFYNELYMRAITLFKKERKTCFVILKTKWVSSLFYLRNKHGIFHIRLETHKFTVNICVWYEISAALVIVGHVQYVMHIIISNFSAEANSFGPQGVNNRMLLFWQWKSASICRHLLKSNTPKLSYYKESPF